MKISDEFLIATTKYFLILSSTYLIIISFNGA
jgi:hypothetical protein